MWSFRMDIDRYRHRYRYMFIHSNYFLWNNYNNLPYIMELSYVFDTFICIPWMSMLINMVVGGLPVLVVFMNLEIYE